MITAGIAATAVALAGVTAQAQTAPTPISSPLGGAGGAIDEAVRQTPPERKATIIGDSAMAGVRWNGALSGLVGFDADDRLESCRRLVNLSCRGREGRTPRTALSEINVLGSAAPTDVLVIATGYNDWHGGFDWQARMILDAARAKGYQTIAWVKYRTGNSYELPGTDNRSNYLAMNAELDRLAESGAYPELRLWDLNQYTAGVPWWFYSDGVHQTWIGSWGVADWISRHMADLDDRPCTLPWNLEIGQEQSCPNPDNLPRYRGYPDLNTIYDF